MGENESMANHDSTRILMRILTGDPVQAMESAKKVIGSRADIDPSLLREIATNKLYKKWSRIAAVYALGFLAHRASAPALIGILEDRDEHFELRGHAAEALGNMGDPRSLAVLDRILGRKERPSIKRWCVYALSQIRNPKARSILKKFEATKPTGVVAKELVSALH